MSSCRQRKFANDSRRKGLWPVGPTVLRLGTTYRCLTEKRLMVDFSDIRRRLDALGPRLDAARGFL